ncbi:hypothetical protein ACJZ2D_012376 [Fusarium nematophilum]
MRVSQQFLALSAYLASSGLTVQAQGEDSYVLVYVECPSSLKIRDPSEGLSKAESSWRQQRGKQMIPQLEDYLKLANISDFDVSSFIKKLKPTNVPIVGLSVSGGGTQSGLGGLGIWQAYDARSNDAIAARTGGLTQLLSYITGLSGGGAVTVSLLAVNNFTITEDLVKATNFSTSYAAGPDGNVEYFLKDIFENTGAKAKAGSPVSIADTFGQFWGAWCHRNNSLVNPDINNIPIPTDEENNQLIQLVNETAEYFNLTFNESLWATYLNPFEDYNNSMKGISELSLVDGSLSGESNPICPLIIPNRKVDLIIVYKASSDAANSWVNGTNLTNSALAASKGNIPFPQIPDVSTMVEISLKNAFQIAIYGNGTVDENWPACLACATIKGSLERLSIKLPSQCQECFEKHCWDGKNNTTKVTAADFDLTPRLEPNLTYEEWNKTEWSAGSSGSGAGSGEDDDSAASMSLVSFVGLSVSVFVMVVLM